jgi:threonine aldolase
MQTGRFIDLRSDTVTLPTEEMLEAIRHADLGDDVYGEDPTVNRLEDMAAAKMGKEAGLLVASGTQANLVSLMSNAQRGELVVLESESHMNWYEVGGISSIAGLMPWPVRSQYGALDPKDVEAAIRPENIHFPQPALVCAENTHNRHGGTVITPAQLESIRRVVDSHGLKLYMDGARIFNAAIALKVKPEELAKHVDNLMFCLSKGLCCPVGSVIVGSREFIKKARKVRKVLGGGMRQAGIIAAAGIVALEKMVERLEEDHKNARRLAEGISKVEGIRVDLARVQTNMVFLDISGLKTSDEVILSKLKQEGILASTLAKNRLRLVTHMGIEQEHVDKAIDVFVHIADDIWSHGSS